MRPDQNGTAHRVRADHLDTALWVLEGLWSLVASSQQPRRAADLSSSSCQAPGRLDHEGPSPGALARVAARDPGDHLSELGDRLPPGGQRDEGEHQVCRVEAVIEQPVVLGLGEPLDLVAVVGRPAGQSRRRS
jgi:hypothetical protein